VSYNPGWYPDPSGQPGVQRYWDGQQWTPHSAPLATAAPPPRRRKSGCAIAGITVGVLGGFVALFVVLIIVAAVGLAVANAVRPAKKVTPLPVTHAAMGQAVTIPAGHRYVGEATITIYSLTVPYAVPAGDNDAGTVAALADAQVCAGDSSADLSNGTVWVPFPFEAIQADGTQDQLGYNDFPNTDQLSYKVRRLGPHQCIRGTLEFSVDAPSTVVGVGYSGTQQLNAEWMLPSPVHVEP
jgi:hypothetical protein